jgi:L-gulono-1,4-lactone dehydrogenase
MLTIRYFVALVGLVNCLASTPIGLLWTNWDGLQQSIPETYLQPRSEEDIIAMVQSAGRNKQTLKVIGSGLSFSGVQLNAAEGNMMSLEKYNKILSIRPADDGSSNSLVEVQAGIAVRDLCELLDQHSLTLVNLGATATQSIAGATATGTHGTGAALGNIASQIHALRVVDAHGFVHYADANTNKELFDAARVGFGAVGIISTMTLTVVPSWKMHVYQQYQPLDQLLSGVDSLVTQYPRVQWSFLPYTNDATVVIREDVPLDTAIYPADPDGGCWSNTQQTSDYNTKNTSVGCTDWSYKTLTDSKYHYDQRSLYTEMEMMIPIEHTEAAIRDYIAFMESVSAQHDPSVYVSVMVRYVAADDIFLSPMYGRETAVISIIVKENNDEFTLYATGLQSLCQEKYHGRPHWGKVNYLLDQDEGVNYLAGAYPDTYKPFRNVMARMDPHGMFLNEYIQTRIR